MKTAKEEALEWLYRLPSDATWQDIIYYLYVRQKIKEGLKAADEGCVLSHDEVKKLFAQ